MFSVSGKVCSSRPSFDPADLTLPRKHGIMMAGRKIPADSRQSQEGSEWQLFAANTADLP
jgi:hypothetical protein